MQNTENFPRPSRAASSPSRRSQALSTFEAMPDASASTTLQYTGIAVFVAAVLFAVLYYSRSFNSIYITRRHDGNANTATLTEDAAVTARPGPVQALGLGPDDVAVLPTFTYRAASPDNRGNEKAPDQPASPADCCAVCLDELREGAMVRMLPSCKHYFHAECVDVWLLSHATCPVCRGSPGPDKVRMGVASLSPPLRQLRRCGASLPDQERGETSRAKDDISSSPPSPVRSPMRLEVIVASMGNGSSAISPSPTRPRMLEGRVCRTRSPSPATTESNGV